MTFIYEWQSDRLLMSISVNEILHLKRWKSICTDAAISVVSAAAVECVQPCKKEKETIEKNVDNIVQK